MKSSLLLSCFALLYASVQTLAGPTLVSGDVSGTWTKTGSPYMLIDHSTVPSDKTLTIEPGVTVVLGEGLSLTVDGGFVAQGTPLNRITFKAPNTNTFWDKIQVNYNGKTNDVLYCDFIGATNALIFNIHELYISTLYARVSNCTFSYCRNAGIQATAIGRVWPDPREQKVDIRCDNLHFTDMPKGISFYVDGERAYSTVVGYGSIYSIISSCVFNNTTNGIVTEEASCGGFSSGTIANNVFANTTAAVVSRSLFDFNIRNNIFLNNGLGVQREGTASSQLGYNCFFNTKSNFMGYPSAYGSIVFENDHGTPCDVAFNIFSDPMFSDTNAFFLSNDSPCIDAGDSAAEFNDLRFPPSKGTALNDMGAYGGPAVSVDDSDNDGLMDSWEIKYFTNLENNGTSDPDQDGLINTQEAAAGTDPTKKDTDGDGYNDKDEIEAGVSPTDPTSVPPLLLTIQVGAVDVEFNSASGHTYQMQASDNGLAWQNILDPIPGNGSLIRNRIDVGTNKFRLFKMNDITTP